MPRFLIAIACFTILAGTTRADPPGLTYLFPAGGQRGTKVTFRAGGLCLYDRCGFALLGPGVTAERELKRTRTVFFEGPILPLPESQRQENYPKDMLGTLTIAPDAPLGKRNAVAWTAEGGASGPVFIVGDLPEIVEREIAGDVVAEPAKLPVTINGRIFPHEDVDEWSFPLPAGAVLSAEVVAEKLGAPLLPRLTALDGAGRRLAESGWSAGNTDARLQFTAPKSGVYRIRIEDARFAGGPEYVYRLTLTAGPHVDSIYPLGGRRGSTTKFELRGANLPHANVALVLPARAPGESLHAFEFGGAKVMPVRIDLDDLPELLEAEPNDESKSRDPFGPPFVANGRIERPGDVDAWPVKLQKGKSYEFDLRARRLDSPLQPVLALLDDQGKEITRSDALEQNAVDSKIAYNASADGIFWLRVHDRFRKRGGPDFSYRLRAAEPAMQSPDFHVTFKPEVIAVERGKFTMVKCECQRLGGFAGPIALRAVGVPSGVSVKPVSIAAKDRTAELRFEASPEALLCGSIIRIEATADVAGKNVTKPAMVTPTSRQAAFDQALLVVAVKPPFVLKSDYVLSPAPRGAVYRKRFRIERTNFTGPLEIRLADRQARHLQGVTGPVLTLAPEVKEFDYPISLPPWMETGRTCRVCVTAVGSIRDRDGNEHKVSFSSVEQHMQMIVVVEPGRLGIELERSSARIMPGGSAAVKVRIARGQGLNGPVQLKANLPEHWHGVQVDQVSIPANQSAATVTLRFATDARGPFSSPLIIRATLLEHGDLITAEAKLELIR